MLTFSIGLGIPEELTFQLSASSLSMKSFATIAWMSKFHQLPFIAQVSDPSSESLKVLRRVCPIKTPFQGMADCSSALSLMHCSQHLIILVSPQTLLWVKPSKAVQSPVMHHNALEHEALHRGQLKAHRSKGQHRLVKSTGTYGTTP